MTTFFYPIILTMLTISALCCMVETAILSSSKARLTLLAQAGDKRAKAALSMLNPPDQMLATILLVFNTLNVFSATLTTVVMVNTFGETGVAYATAIISVATLLLTEALPKSIGAKFPEPLTLASAIPLQILVKILFPATWAIKQFNSFVLYILGLNRHKNPDFTESDLRGAISLGLQSGTIHAREHRMLDAVLDLDDLTVADVMIHRSAIIALDINTLPENVPTVLGQLKHSRVPVYKGKQDNIIGFLFVRDYLAALGQVTSRHEIDLKQHIRPAYYVPETTPVGYQLIEFLKNRKHLALIVDEYGDLQGLITLEDILEEIVGEIADEHDPAMTEVQTTPDGIITLPGRFAVRDANRRFGWNLPEDNAVTMAGLMMDVLGHLPAQGESTIINNLRLVVSNKRGHRIERMTIAQLPDPAKADA